MPKSTIAGEQLQDRRGFVIMSLFLGGIMATGSLAKSPENRMTVLFVCQAGTAKSAIAREMFKKRAAERGISAEVFSRGIVIADHVSPELRQKLLADGIDSTAEPAMPLSPSDWALADILLNFNPLPASVEHKDARDWSDVPSVNDDYVNARALMSKRIDALLSEIAVRPK
jgi:protein-tyrosine-phosphatase